jgi:hypothetical protein
VTRGSLEEETEPRATGVCRSGQCSRRHQGIDNAWIGSEDQILEYPYEEGARAEPPQRVNGTCFALRCGGRTLTPVNR